MCSDRKKLQEMYCYEVARIGKAVASPSRLLIIDSLYSGPLTVEAIADETGLTVANTSQHLQRLKDARLLQSEKHGLQVTYRLAGPEVADFYDSLRKIAGKRLLEVQSIIEQFADDAQALDWVDFETLLERAKRGDVTVIDVRPREEYDSGHFPGALSVPLDELEKNAEKLPENIAEGFVRAYIGKRGKILGVDIAGEGSGEMINEWASFHHGRMDGSGYPFRIHGDNLSVGSRIMIVSDIFAAITEDRPYRQGMAPGKALTVIQELAKKGTICSCFYEVISDNFSELNDIRDEIMQESRREYENIRKKLPER